MGGPRAPLRLRAVDDPRGRRPLGREWIGVLAFWLSLGLPPGLLLALGLGWLARPGRDRFAPLGLVGATLGALVTPPWLLLVVDATGATTPPRGEVTKLLALATVGAGFGLLTAVLYRCSGGSDVESRRRP